MRRSRLEKLINSRYNRETFVKELIETGCDDKNARVVYEDYLNCGSSLVGVYEKYVLVGSCDPNIDKFVEQFLDNRYFACVKRVDSELSFFTKSLNNIIAKVPEEVAKIAVVSVVSTIITTILLVTN